MKTLMNESIAVIGAGNIGKMLLDRLHLLGFPENQLFVSDSAIEKATTATALEGGQVIDLTSDTVHNVSIWLLCMGPKAVLPFLRTLSHRLKPGQIVISFAAAVPMQKLQAYVPQGVGIVRVMPNIPSLIGQGMNPVCFAQGTSEQTRMLVLELLKALGESVEVNDQLMNACVGLSGAAMRSVFPAIEGMFRAGIEAGFSEKEAKYIVAQSFVGAAALVKQSSLSIQELKRMTPMETLSESLVEQIFYDSTAGVIEKMDSLQEKILLENQ